MAELLHGANLLAMLVVDSVFSVDLKKLGLLAYHQYWFCEERSAADLSASCDTRLPDLLLNFLIGLLDGVNWRALDGRIE
ncbi:hypothetical protein GCM10009655_05350 [Rhodoglobus aureus]|uniref:Uncharacterized protein n=1 Tax=Rhodoglobus aureus TaxID=191497 RepID=A0ABN1VFG2_9MICO